MTSRLVVLRHASAGLRRDWSDGDDSRPLDHLGGLQARALVDSLADLPLDHVLTSRYVRCRETVAELAAARDLPVVDAGWLAEGSGRAEVTAGLADLAADTLVCTHGDIVAVIAATIAPDRVLAPLGKAAAWVIELADGEPVNVTVRPAPDPEPANEPLRR